MIIALDGPAGVGKSTVSKILADKLGFFYLNSGNFYRAVTLAVINSGGNPQEENDVIAAASSSTFNLTGGRMILDGRDVEDDLHSDAVDKWVAEHSAIVEVRHIVNRLLRQCTADLDIVAEGRDITTVVFPDADLKVFMDADPAVRAQRRFDQGTSSLKLEEIEENIRKRDVIDRNKREGSLKLAADALYLDTTHLTIEQVCEKVLSKIDSHARS